MPKRSRANSRAVATADAQQRKSKRLAGRSKQAETVLCGEDASALKKETARTETIEAPVPTPDGRCRCDWACAYVGASRRTYRLYHDEEWGEPAVDDSKLLEFLVLDGAQCGLSWSTILHKRPAYTASFHNWDVAAIAAMTEADVEALLLPESGIVRHRGKVQSAVHNARLVLQMQKENTSFAAFLWSFLPEQRPIVNSWKKMAELPAVTDEAKAMSVALKKRGFKFVGPTMVYAMMQSAGMVNDHIVSCFRHAELQRTAASMKWPF